MLFLNPKIITTKNKEFLAEIQKSLLSLQEDPLHTVGWESGSLKGKKSTPNRC
jgi:hypothetical protein